MVTTSITTVVLCGRTVKPPTSMVLIKHSARCQSFRPSLRKDGSQCLPAVDLPAEALFVPQALHRIELRSPRGGEGAEDDSDE